MVTIYLSSTYDDLKDHRQEVYKTLRQLRHDVIGMETDVAADMRPLDRCLADVAACELYIGLIAWRYGYIPPTDNPKRRSITELEYRQAVELGKPQLIFLLDDNAPWPRPLMDSITGEGDAGTRIDTFRRELRQEHLISVFTTPEDLAHRVSVAVSQWDMARATSGSSDGGQIDDKRAHLLCEVKKETEDRLKRGLHQNVLFKLRKENQPHHVIRPWDSEIKIDTQQSTQLPFGMEIAAVFDQEATAGKLLILGEPGAGKTTELLQLAQELTSRATRDPEAPMPVLLNLSFWKDDTQTIAQWLVAELHNKYGIHQDIGQQWMNERRLALLLDGLDELEPSRQATCVERLNQFLHDSGFGARIV